MKSRQPASRRRWLKVSLLLVAPVASMASNVFSAAEPVRFGRDVLPILSANCFACHGPDEKNRKAGLRLDLEADAKATRRRGAPIAPGQPEKSLIIARLTSADPDVVMPPPSAHKQVKPEQIETLRRWIAEGAKWGRHWSFEPLLKPVIASERRPVDALVSAALAKKGLALRAPAAPQTLTRRLWLDLIGLPPTPEIADKFAADPSPEAYERMVDELLKKPQFGEHWARMWLDLTTAQVWMGLTMGCAKCHTHKYDPISQAEYYSFYALFNQTEDADRYDDAPTMEVLSPADQDERKRLFDRSASGFRAGQ